MPAAIHELPAQKTSKKPPKKSPAVSVAPRAAGSSVRSAPNPAAKDHEISPAPPVPITFALLPEVADALQKEADKRGVSLDTVALDALHRGLRRILAGDNTAALLKQMGLVPRKPLPPGKTLKNVMDELRNSLPPDEDDPYTDADYLRALERD